MRLALICYGGVSLAVYMHGITKEIWRLAAASEAYHSRRGGNAGSIYRRLIQRIVDEGSTELRVLVDILSGSSAGGINAIFLAQAIATGQSLDPLTDLWLEFADVDALIDPGVGRMSRFAKGAAVPFAWAMSSRRGGAVDETVEPAHRQEVRAKLASFVRARWFAPPFGGAGFTRLLLEAFEAMANEPCGPPLLPQRQPLDLFVTVTDFHGHPERLRLNSPPEALETEHRLTLGFRDPGGRERRLADVAELAFAARATASFPGAFPPFRVGELDQVLAERGQAWAGRGAFLKRALPGHSAAGEAERAVLIDGSVLANAPFKPAIDALRRRPARRLVDRRFVYIDPKPGIRSLRLRPGGDGEPGFFAAILGALSDLPREQPIRDNLEAIQGRSERIRRLRHVLASMRTEVEGAIERTFGTTLLLGRPTAKRLAGWRERAQTMAAREAGYAYAAYGHLKLSSVVEEIVAMLHRLSGQSGRGTRAKVRDAAWNHVRAAGLTSDDAITGRGARGNVIEFLRNYDVAYRIRRLRFVAWRLAEIENSPAPPSEAIEAAREAVNALIGRYQSATEADGKCAIDLQSIATDPAGALRALAGLLDLKNCDDAADEAFSAALATFPKRERRALILSYLGFPFFDVATLAMLQGEGLDEFDPIKIDRISPDDATAIRAGGAQATLKGIQLNSFGAFFSRAYRENDYLWGRLHGADRLIDIVVSALHDRATLAPGAVTQLKREAFLAILAEERPRLRAVQTLIDDIEREIGPR